jgi:plasmid stabilization system protein ParE
MRRVKVWPKAEADVRRITARISDTVSPYSAAQWHERLRAKIARLAEDARIWPEADEAALVGRDLRMMLFDRRRHVYRILFTIDGDTVNVLRIRHAAQDALTQDDL